MFFKTMCEGRKPVMLLQKKKAKKENLTVVEDDKCPKSKRYTLNLKFLKDADDDMGNLNQKEPVISFIDRKNIEEQVVDTVNALSAEEKNNIGEHLRGIIKTMINEECRRLLVEQDNPVVDIKASMTDTYAGDNVNTSEAIHNYSHFFTSKEEYIRFLEDLAIENISIACIYATNKAIVKKNHGIQAANNIHETIINSLSAIFGIEAICTYDDEYFVYGKDTDSNEFFDNLNLFRKSIFSVNTSNQFRFPIELNISNVETAEYASTLDALNDAKIRCLGDDELIKSQTANTSINSDVIMSEKEDRKTISSAPYKKMEFLDIYEEERTEDFKTSYLEKDIENNMHVKNLDDFPRVFIRGKIKEKKINKTIEFNLTIHMIGQNSIKQNILVSGKIGAENILLLSNGNEDTTTLMLSEKYGLILRFGSAIKTFILKEKKEYFELWQEITRDIFEKRPFIVDDMIVCPVGKNTNMTAFVSMNNNNHSLIKTSTEGNVVIEGKRYSCFNDGNKIIIES